LLERDHLRPALVLQHFGCNGSALNRGHAKHRRIAAKHQNFAKLHDRADGAFDLSYLEYIIWDDTVLPAAGFDDCEHRLIPSCSIPASDGSGPAFSTVAVGMFSARAGERSLRAHAKTSGARKSRAGCGEL